MCALVCVRTHAFVKIYTSFLVFQPHLQYNVQLILYKSNNCLATELSCQEKVRVEFCGRRCCVLNPLFPDPEKGSKQKHRWRRHGWALEKSNSAQGWINIRLKRQSGKTHESGWKWKRKHTGRSGPLLTQLSHWNTKTLTWVITFCRSLCGSLLKLFCHGSA